MNFFTAVWRFETAKQKRHENYIAALEAVGVTAHRGEFSKAEKWCVTEKRYCAFQPRSATNPTASLRTGPTCSAGREP